MLSALALQGAEKSPTIVAVAIPVVSFGLPILETVLSVLRRLISGRPVFTADREHIHHKLLERGLSHRQVVIVLYAVSAVFALLSLFLLWPTGSTLGLILAVLGTECGLVFSTWGISSWRTPAGCQTYDRAEKRICQQPRYPPRYGRTEDYARLRSIVPPPSVSIFRQRF